MPKFRHGGCVAFLGLREMVLASHQGGPSAPNPWNWKPNAGRDALIPILQAIQDHDGNLSQEEVVRIGRAVRLVEMLARRPGHRHRAM